MKTRKEIKRYLIVTPFIGATDFGLYYLLIYFRLPYSMAKAISYTIANVISYLFSKYWIFKRQTKQEGTPEIGRYFILDVILFIFNVAANQAILFVWPKSIFLAITTASILTASLSFTFNKLWVFKTAFV
jgi:putative flippase GtrA